MSSKAYRALELEPAIQGKVKPRLFTPPLVVGPPGECGCGCALSRDTSLGFAVDDFAREVLRRPLFPWQRWLVIHAMELLPNGWPRFRQVLVLVGRQNGKTELLVILSLFWLWVQEIPMVLGTSTKLDYSRISWKKAIKLARAIPELRTNIRVRRENGKEELAAVWDVEADDESVYKIAASNEEGGRSLTIHRLVEDELRQHYDYSAHEAAENAMNAVDDAQAWAITNEGDDRAVVLHDLHDAALSFIAQGEGDPRLGLFSYSAEAGCDLLDVEQAAQANPSMGQKGGVSWASLVGKAKRAQLKGGEVEAKYRTEVLCQRVRRLSVMPVSLDAWEATGRALAEGETPESVPAFFLCVGDEQASAAIAVAAKYRITDPLTGETVVKPHVELAGAGAGTDWLEARIKDLRKAYPAAKWGAPNAGTTRAWAPKLALMGIGLELFNIPETALACAHLQTMTNGLALTHSPNEAVVQSLTGAERRKLDGGAWVWDWKESTADLAPLVAETGALWLLESQPTFMPSFGWSK